MLTLALAALAAVSVAPQDNSRWGDIGASGDARLFVETSSIAGAPTGREIKVLIVQPQARADGYRATLAWLILDCTADAGRIYEIQEWSQDGQLMGRTMPTSAASPNVPDSPRARAAAVACGAARWQGEPRTMREIFTP